MAQLEGVCVSRRTLRATMPNSPGTLRGVAGGNLSKYRVIRAAAHGTKVALRPARLITEGHFPKRQPRLLVGAQSHGSRLWNLPEQPGYRRKRVMGSCLPRLWERSSRHGRTAMLTRRSMRALTLLCLLLTAAFGLLSR